MGKTPHKYRKEFASLAYDLCLLGYTDQELAVFFSVSRQSIANWKSQYPAFAQAVTSGKEIADAIVARSLYLRATGMTIQEQHVVKVPGGGAGGELQILTTEKQLPPDPKAGMHWLHNRQPGKWSRKVEIRVVEVSQALDPLDKDAVIDAVHELTKSLE